MTAPEERSHRYAAFDALRDGVGIVASDGSVRYTNPSLQEILGMSAEELAGRSVWSVFPAWADGAPGSHLRRAMRERVPVSFRVGEETRPVGGVWEVEAVPVDGDELCLRFRNVTEQVRVEELRRQVEETSDSLAEREARLHAILEGAPAGIVLMDADTFTVREANPAYYAFLEGEWQRPGSIVGRRFDEFIPGFDALGTADLFRRVRDTGEPFEIAEYEFTGFERGTTYFRWTLKPLLLRPDGRPRYLLLLVVEITEQVVARRAVEEERRTLYDVLDGLPVGVAVAEAPEGRIVYLNPAAVVLSGHSPAELAAPGVGEYAARWHISNTSGEPFPSEQLPLALALRGEDVRDMELTLERPGGERRTVLVNGVPLRNTEGEVTRGVVAFYDVTDRIRLEQALLERTAEAEEAAGDAALRAEESRALREMSRALVSVLDPEHVLRLAAAHAMELLDVAGSFVTKPDPGGETMRVGPALGSLRKIDGNVFRLEGSVVERVVREQQPLIYNSMEEVPAGSPLATMGREIGIRNIVMVPMRAYGERLGVLGVVDREGGFSEEHARLLEGLADSAALALHNARMYADERRRAEENRALLAAAEALTSTLDPSEVTERIVNLARELTRAEGAGLTVFVGEEGSHTSMPVAVGILAPFRGQEGPRGGSLSDLVALGGEPRVISAGDLGPETSIGPLFREVGITEFAVVPLRAGGETFGVLGVANAHTSRSFDAEDLRVLSLLGDQAALAVRNAQMYEAAHQASHAKSEFLAMMSHELRTPLNALEGYASLLEDGIYGPLTDAQRNALAKMRTSRRHLMELIEQILDIARLEAGRKRVEPQEFNLGFLVQEVAEALRGAAEAKGLMLEEATLDGTGRISTDMGMVRQILTNLLGNAIKFTERGDISVRASGSPDRVWVVVSDTGPGIAREHHERIFEPFYQVDGSRTRKEGGSGLGLALSREFARLLGGDLVVRSEPGRGSTFELVLPRRFVPPGPGAPKDPAG